MPKIFVELAKRRGQDWPRASTPLAALKSVMCFASVDNNAGGTTSRRDRIYHSIRCLERVLFESPDITITLSDLASLLNLERTHCCRVIREVTGKLFTDWIREIRIQRARSLLLLPGLSITEVSLAVGYADLTTFGRNFRKECGMSPKAFRQMQLVEN